MKDYRYLILLIFMIYSALNIVADTNKKQGLSQQHLTSDVNPKVVAHRGYWKAQGSAQNSIRSLHKADSINCFSTELDVWITKDSVVIIHHDPTINDFVIQDSYSSDILSNFLSNGERVPTLEEYLEEAMDLGINLVCEIKPHKDKNQELLAVEKVLQSISEKKLQDRTDFITFSKNAFEALIEQSSPESMVYYLYGDYTPLQIKELGGDGIDYDIGLIKRQHGWIKESHDLGLLVNVWTVNNEEDMEWCIEHGVDFITTDNPEQLQLLMKKRRL